MKQITRWLYKRHRRGWSSERYIRRQIQTTIGSMTFCNSIYAWLIMTGMITSVTRSPKATTLIDWVNHPRNIMSEESADTFLSAVAIVQSVDSHLMRNMSRYAKLLGYQYTGSVVTADEVLAVVDAVMKATKQ